MQTHEHGRTKEVVSGYVDTAIIRALDECRGPLTRSRAVALILEGTLLRDGIGDENKD